jgi:ActR/RegA family two-component response regulator
MPTDISERALGGSNRPGRIPGGPAATVVVLDDDRDFRFGVVRVLRNEGFVVEEAADVATLLAILNRTPVDVILADSRLADGADGWREALALSGRYPNTRVVAVTGYDADAIAAFEGVVLSGFVRKSDGPSVIVQAVLDASRG